MSGTKRSDAISCRRLIEELCGVEIIELAKFQGDVIKRGDRILVLIEGRDATGKDGVRLVPSFDGVLNPIRLIPNRSRRGAHCERYDGDLAINPATDA
jgi:polyphosphate kinase 2 (PPK2 family)